VLEHFVDCEYHEKITVCEGLSIRFVDAGHLLGSSSIEIWVTEEGQTKKLVFSGDIGRGNRPLIKDPEYLTEADYVIMESTYGNRNHETSPDYAKELAKVMTDTFVRGGNLVIPAFSVGRTQEMLYFMRRIKTEGLLPQFPNFEVYIDSPLAVEATNIFHKNVAECFNENALAQIQMGVNPIQFPGLRVAVTSDESRMINFDSKPKVIISASGMCEAGRIRHHLKHNLWRKDSTILFVGYQVPGTLGSALLGGAKTVRLFGEEIEVRAKIVQLPGMSGHADRDGLTRWVSSFEKAPRKVFIVHGEENTAVGFADHVTHDVGFDAVAPYSGDVYDLLTGEQIAEGSHKLAEKKTQKSGHATNTVFDRLVAAGERLCAVIRKCQGMANKDLGKFADQINSLCDKWDR
jgi:metallo-beta-lactamase family protein